LQLSDRGVRKLASIEIHADEDRIAIRLSSKPGQRLDTSEIDACLDHTIGKAKDPGRPTAS
jgi:hypothetical protein